MLKSWHIVQPLLFVSAFLVSACSVAKPTTPPPKHPPLAVARMVKICTFPRSVTIHMKFGAATFYYEEYQRNKQPYDLVALLESFTKINCEFSIAEIHGYTSSAGDADANMELSRLRAVAVQEWLGRQGYPADTAEIIAHGENDPFLKTGNDVREALNDRVEVLITGISDPPDTDPNRPPYDCLICMEKQGYPIPPLGTPPPKNQ